MSNRSWRRASALSALGTVLLLLVGCGGDGGGDVALPKFQPDMKHWRLPLDAYVIDPGAESYARSLVYGQCLRKAGFVPPPAQGEGAFIPPTFNENLRSLFDVEIAQKYGYHGGRPPGGAHHERAPQTAAERTARSTCGIKANKELAVSDSVQTTIYSFKGAAYKSAMKSQAIAKASGRWRDCMLPLGLPDLPDVFEDGIMPTPSQRERFHMRAPGAVDAKTSLMPTTVDEIHEAVFDAKCRDSSGLTKTLYDLEVDKQLAYIKKYREDLGAAYEANQETGSTIDKVIKRYDG